ncbi:MAG: DNA primase, partial [Bdellovibrionales bacterium]|nr:DNA primase [Bdellovibrionales bacterium]
MISQETISEVKNRVNIVDVVGEVVNLRQAGNNFVGLCPFHNEKTGSFNVRPQDAYYHCFGCGASGNVITFVMEQQGLSFPEAIELLASRYGIDVKREGKIRDAVKSESPDP